MKLEKSWNLVNLNLFWHNIAWQGYNEVQTKITELPFGFWYQLLLLYRLKLTPDFHGDGLHVLLVETNHPSANLILNLGQRALVPENASVIFAVSFLIEPLRRFRPCRHSFDVRDLFEESFDVDP